MCRALSQFSEEKSKNKKKLHDKKKENNCKRAVCRIAMHKHTQRMHTVDRSEQVRMSVAKECLCSVVCFSIVLTSTFPPHKSFKCNLYIHTFVRHQTLSRYIYSLCPALLPFRFNSSVFIANVCVHHTQNASISEKLHEKSSTVVHLIPYSTVCTTQFIHLYVKCIRHVLRLC